MDEINERFGGFQSGIRHQRVHRRRRFRCNASNQQLNDQSSLHCIDYKPSIKIPGLIDGTLLLLDRCLNCIVDVIHRLLESSSIISGYSSSPSTINNIQQPPIHGSPSIFKTPFYYSTPKKKNIFT